MTNISPDNFIADKLIAAHDGDVALLYIWLCRYGAFDPDRAARDLCKTSREIESAYEKLQRLELFVRQEAPQQEPVHQKLPEPEDTLPEYTASDILQRSSSDEGFKAVLVEAQRVLGKKLSSPDMKTLFGIYDYLALPTEVIFLLLNHCVQSCAAKYGPGRLPSMRSIEKEAYSWVNREILTVEQAEEFIDRAARRRSAVGKIQEALNLRGRALTATESRYIDSWLNMGFDAEAVSIAYDRTVTNTGALKWSYMNKILQSWNEKGLHTAAEIEEKDRRAPAPVKGIEHSSNVSDADLEYLKAVYEKVKNTNK